MTTREKRRLKKSCWYPVYDKQTTLSLINQLEWLKEHRSSQTNKIAVIKLIIDERSQQEA